MRGRKHATGWMIALRRLGGLGAGLFALIFAIGLLRGEAVALAAGDEVCVFMGGNLPPRLTPADPSDLADHSHDCCDLGLCLAAGFAPPPASPSVVAAPRAVLRLRRRPRRRLAPASATPRDRRSRGPPTV